MTPSLRLICGWSVGLTVLGACGGQALDVGSSSSQGGASGSSSGGTGMVGNGTPSQSGAGSGAATGTPMAGSATGGGGSTPKSASQGPWPSSADCKSGASAVEGTWSGYVQGEGHAYDFTLVLGGGEAQPCGTLTIGEPRDYPPATDPEHNITADEFYFKAPPLLPGYTYTVLDAALDASRLQFRLSFAEAYASWCALQTSYPNPAGDEYRCLPSSYNTNYVVHGDRCVGTVDGMPVDVACEHVTMCLDVEGDNAPCFCDASGCAANLEASGAQFDLHVDGDQASGLWDDRNVFLQRQ